MLRSLWGHLNYGSRWIALELSEFWDAFFCTNWLKQMDNHKDHCSIYFGRTTLTIFNLLLFHPVSPTYHLRFSHQSVCHKSWKNLTTHTPLGFPAKFKQAAGAMMQNHRDSRIVVGSEHIIISCRHISNPRAATTSIRTLLFFGSLTSVFNTE